MASSSSDRYTLKLAISWLLNQEPAQALAVLVGRYPFATCTSDVATVERIPYRSMLSFGWRRWWLTDTWEICPPLNSRILLLRRFTNMVQRHTVEALHTWMS